MSGDTDPFSVFDVAPGSNVSEADPFGLSSPFWFGYVDAYGGGIHALQGNVASAPLIANLPAGATEIDPPAMAAGTDNLPFLFYTVYDYPHPFDTTTFWIHYNGSTWSTPAVLTQGTYMDDPGTEPGLTAVQFNGAVWVFGLDRGTESLGAWQSNGTQFVPGGMDNTPWIDGSATAGLSGGAGQTTDFAGSRVSAIVSGSVVYVFYSSSLGVRVASFSTTGWFSGIWFAATLDASSFILWPVAPTIMPGYGLQIYYVDETTHVLRQSTLTNGVWGGGVIDGTTTGSNCAGHGATGDHVTGPVSAVIRSSCSTTGPYVFYGDATTNALREAFWR